MSKIPEQPKLTKEVRCPACNSSYAYYRRKTKDFVCRKCGKVYKAKLQKVTERW